MDLNQIFKTPVLLEHSINVFRVALRVIDYLPNELITKQQAMDLMVAAIYHDVGKYNWLSDWFVKPRYAISKTDWTVMQTHPIQSVNLLKSMDIQISNGASKIILQHHERPGGIGYPYGIEPDFISIVFSACDVYCACMEKREYRAYEMNAQQALAQVKEFAPDIVVDALQHSFFERLDCINM